MAKQMGVVPPGTTLVTDTPPEELVGYIKFINQFKKLNAGLAPTQAQVIQQIGGSFTTVVKAFKWLRDQEAIDLGLEQRYAALPEPIQNQIEKNVIESLRRLSVVLWNEALELADAEARFHKRRAEEVQRELEIQQIESANNIRFLEDQILQLKAEHKI